MDLKEGDLDNLGIKVFSHGFATDIEMHKETYT